jgi:hypothetical protein
MFILVKRLLHFSVSLLQECQAQRVTHFIYIIVSLFNLLADSNIQSAQITVDAITR